jgi:hypothetical protein
MGVGFVHIKKIGGRTDETCTLDFLSSIRRLFLLSGHYAFHHPTRTTCHDGLNVCAFTHAARREQYHRDLTWIGIEPSWCNQDPTEANATCGLGIGAGHDRRSRMTSSAGRDAEHLLQSLPDVAGWLRRLRPPEADPHPPTRHHPPGLITSVLSNQSGASY